MGWVFIGLMLVVPVAAALVVDTDLIAERMTRGKSVPRWDRTVLGLYGIMSGLVTLAVAGFDVRFVWSPEVPWGVKIAAAIVFAAAWGIHIWAMACNKFFAKVARIQDDRRQTVATGGPYRCVRHPGYAAGILFEITRPLLLRSLYGLIPGILAALLLVVRTILEDRMLREKLDGYAEYSEQVRYRLIPGAW